MVHSSNFHVVGFCPIELLKFSFPVRGLAPRTFTKGEFSQAISPVEVTALDSKRLPKSAKPAPLTTLLKQSSTGAKRKREEKPNFECLDVEGSRKKEGAEPTLLSEDESSSDDDRDMKMPNLPSSSGTTRSTSKGGEDGAADSEDEKEIEATPSEGGEHAAADSEDEREIEAAPPESPPRPPPSLRSLLPRNLCRLVLYQRQHPP